jgi:hypothetical protein
MFVAMPYMPFLLSEKLNSSSYSTDAEPMCEMREIVPNFIPVFFSPLFFS